MSDDFKKLSIHPRNWPDKVHSSLGWRERRKKNTAQPRGTRDRTVAGLSEHLSRHPNDRASEAHLAALQDA